MEGSIKLSRSQRKTVLSVYRSSGDARCAAGASAVAFGRWTVVP